MRIYFAFCETCEGGRDQRSSPRTKQVLVVTALTSRTCLSLVGGSDSVDNSPGYLGCENELRVIYGSGRIKGQISETLQK